MNDHSKKNRWSPLSMMLAVVVLFVIYVLSIGPVYFIWHMSGNIIPEAVWDWIVFVFYSPLTWIGENVEPFGDFINWYLELWGG